MWWIGGRRSVAGQEFQVMDDIEKCCYFLIWVRFELVNIEFVLHGAFDVLRSFLYEKR